MLSDYSARLVRVDCWWLLLKFLTACHPSTTPLVRSVKSARIRSNQKGQTESLPINTRRIELTDYLGQDKRIMFVGVSVLIYAGRTTKFTVSITTCSFRWNEFRMWILHMYLDIKLLFTRISQKHDRVTCVTIDNINLINFFNSYIINSIESIRNICNQIEFYW